MSSSVAPCCAAARKPTTSPPWLRKLLLGEKSWDGSSWFARRWLAHPAADRSASAVPFAIPARLLAVCGLAIVVTYLCLLAPFPLSEPDEARYAEIPREMIASGDWVTPRLNYVKYFEKPPLLYWLTAVNFKLFGYSDLVARLWPALFGLAGILMAALLGRSMYGPGVGGLAAAVLATTPFYFGLSQVLILDMPLSALMTLALGAFWFAYRDAEGRPWFVGLLYGATALAMLTKGPVAVVLIAGIIGAFLVLQRQLGALRWVLSPWGIGLFSLIALPWFVLVSYRHPEFIDFFIVKQHLARFLAPDEHRQSLWFFVPIIVGGMLPWTLFIVFAPRITVQFLARLIRQRVSPAALYCVVWIGVIFSFFSLSGSKLATYVLPLFCPLAILTARFFEELIAGGHVAVLRRGTLAFLLVGAGALVGGAVTGEFIDDWNMRIILPRVYGGGLMVVATALVALVLLRRRRLVGSIAALVVGLLGLQAIAISGRGVVRHYEQLGRAIREQARPNDLIVTYQHYVQGIPFYGRRRTVMVRGWGELDFGRRQGHQEAYFWQTDEELLQAWRLPRHVFLVINRVELDPLRPRMHPPPRQVAAQGKKVLVANFD